MGLRVWHENILTVIRMKDKRRNKPKKPRQSRSKVNVTLIGFFDNRALVHHEFVSEGQMVNKEYYLVVSKRIREEIRQKRPDLRNSNS